jgi:hypothetical protein
MVIIQIRRSVIEERSGRSGDDVKPSTTLILWLNSDIVANAEE